MQVYILIPTNNVSDIDYLEKGYTRFCSYLTENLNTGSSRDGEKLEFTFRIFINNVSGEEDTRITSGYQIYLGNGLSISEIRNSMWEWCKTNLKEEDWWCMVDADDDLSLIDGDDHVPDRPYGANLLAIRDLFINSASPVLFPQLRVTGNDYSDRDCFYDRTIYSGDSLMLCTNYMGKVYGTQNKTLTYKSLIDSNLDIEEEDGFVSYLLINWTDNLIGNYITGMFFKQKAVLKIEEILRAGGKDYSLFFNDKRNFAEENFLIYAILTIKSYYISRFLIAEDRDDFDKSFYENDVTDFKYTFDFNIQKGPSKRLSRQYIESYGEKSMLDAAYSKESLLYYREFVKNLFNRLSELNIDDDYCDDCILNTDKKDDYIMLLNHMVQKKEELILGHHLALYYSTRDKDDIDC